MNAIGDPKLRASVTAQEDRILGLFAAGYTLDGITATDPHAWTRARVTEVARAHGLTLDAAGQWTGRPHTARTRIPAQRRHTDRQEQP